MKPKIELNREYPTREGGIGVVHFIDSDRLIGRIKHSGCDVWVPKCWHSDGLVFVDTHSHSDLLLPRTVMVPVEIILRRVEQMKVESGNSYNDGWNDAMDYIREWVKARERQQARGGSDG